MTPEPKRIRRQYRRKPIVVTFIPATRMWRWEVRYLVERCFDGEADTMQKALKKAQETIDRIQDV